jgi:hypothetical protein
MHQFWNFQDSGQRRGQNGGQSQSHIIFSCWSPANDAALAPITLSFGLYSQKIQNVISTFDFSLYSIGQTIGNESQNWSHIIFSCWNYTKTIHLRFWLQFQPLSFGLYGENKSNLLEIFDLYRPKGGGQSQNQSLVIFHAGAAPT